MSGVGVDIRPTNGSLRPTNRLRNRFGAGGRSTMHSVFDLRSRPSGLGRVQRRRARRTPVLLRQGEQNGDLVSDPAQSQHRAADCDVFGHGVRQLGRVPRRQHSLDSPCQFEREPQRSWRQAKDRLGDEVAGQRVLQADAGGRRGLRLEESGRIRVQVCRDEGRARLRRAGRRRRELHHTEVRHHHRRSC